MCATVTVQPGGIQRELAGQRHPRAEPNAASSAGSHNQSRRDSVLLQEVHFVWCKRQHQPQEPREDRQQGRKVPFKRDGRVPSVAPIEPGQESARQREYPEDDEQDDSRFADGAHGSQDEVGGHLVGQHAGAFRFWDGLEVGVLLGPAVALIQQPHSVRGGRDRTVDQQRQKEADRRHGPQPQEQGDAHAARHVRCGSARLGEQEQAQPQSDQPRQQQDGAQPPLPRRRDQLSVASRGVGTPGRRS